MSFDPMEPTADELKFLDCLSLINFARRVGTLVETVQYLIDEHDLPTVEIEGETYIAWTDGFLAWLETANLHAIWTNAPKKYLQGFRSFEAEAGDPLKVGAYFGNCAYLTN